MYRRMLCTAIAVHTLALLLSAAETQKPDASPIDTSRGDRMIAEYFRNQTQRITESCLADIKTLDDWNARRAEFRQQLFEMLGLDPLPERTLLKPVVTGRVEHELFAVEKLHFQSRPGLYVTGNLYIPKSPKGKAPTILYVCGHGRVKKGGISYGNKTYYQHHGGWFARNGYVCLIIDTLQLGEIEGIHHGTYRHGMWWWNARGYTSAGVEAWNCIRALDYLQTRDEVDPKRIGVTGRSGGGAYSWWIAALDDRIKAAVPVAGITTLKNHVVDGCVEGHCDCMYMVNTYRWDYAQVAALIAPRPLLISNTDKDRIFPLDGVVDVYTKVRRIYELHGKLNHIGLQITEGPHKDTQELRVHAFHWFNKFLKGEDPLIETTAVKLFEPGQLRVFDELPADQKNTEIHDTFTATAPTPPAPESPDRWQQQKSAWMTALTDKCFRGWPSPSSGNVAPVELKPVFDVTHDSLRFSAYDFTSQQPIRLRLFLVRRANVDPGTLEQVVLNVLDSDGWSRFLSAMSIGFAQQLNEETVPKPDPEALVRIQAIVNESKWGIAYVAPRGIGPTAWDQSERKQTQHRRRFMLLGQTLDGMRVWDVRRAVQAVRSIDGLKDIRLWLEADGVMAGVALYASLFEPDIQRLELHNLPKSHHEGPIYLNVLRFLDVPQAVALAAERSEVRIHQEEPTGWEYPQSAAKTLGWKGLQIRVVQKSE